MIIDNKKNRYPDNSLNIITLWDFINVFSGKESGEKGRMDLVTGYFTITALSKMYEDFTEDNHIRIISSEIVQDDYKKDLVVDILGGDVDLMSIGQLDKQAQQAIAFLERESVEMRAEIPDFCHAKAYIFNNSNPRSQSYYITGSSNFTPAGLGIKKTANVELNIAETCNTSNSEFRELQNWYEDIWRVARTEVPEDINDKHSAKIPIKEYFIRKIKEYFRTYSPEEIYYKTLYELFNSDIDLESGIEHREDMQTLQNSEIWNTLFNYQQKGVISLIKMLRKYNGAILADAVGLGKTFSALAVIKYFQTKGYTTVLFCPKKLQQNWAQYHVGSNSRFEKDGFNYEVRFHTDLQDDRLQNNYDYYKLDVLQNRERLLIVIDESHNLRNEKSSRYAELLEKLIKTQSQKPGRQLKVLLLSATPINTGLRDVKGQFNLIGRGKDDAFNTVDFGVESLQNLFTDSQKKYTDWCGDDDRTVGSFIAKLQPKFFNLTDKLIVARTRNLIEKTLGENMGFPEKAKPVNIYQGVDHFGKYKTTDEIYEAFDKLTLTAYQPSLFIPESQKEAKKGAKSDWDDNVNRERFLVKMMGILFMKRLESSWHSCMLTVKKVLDVHKQTLELVEAYKKNKRAGTLPAGESVGEDDDQLEEQFALRKGTIRLSEMKNLGGFEAGLRYNVNRLTEIYESLLAFETAYRNGTEKDLKLEELIKILNEKKEAENKKIVIFTAYSDTAKFLFDELQERGFNRIASVSGSATYTSGLHQTNDFQEVLQSFAPYSKLYKEKDWNGLYADAGIDTNKYYKLHNGKGRWDVPFELWKQTVKEHRPDIQRLLDDPIDILIASDCLSEGQNLQDADMQVNYDIHWNPVRLIQRFGRIDRIGSPNKEVKCVNFWPAASFEQYLNLENRIMNRMATMNLVGSETQELNDAYLKMVQDNPLVDKNANRLLAELQRNSISDIESPQTLSLKDFSFEVYRQDLFDYFEKNKDFFRSIPNGVFSGFRALDNLFENIPESLVAVVGYPHREEGSKKPYSEIYLMCQPVDTNLPTTYKELNRAEVLDFLRQNKKQERFVPEWIEAADNNRLKHLTEILQSWMKLKVPQQATAAILQLAQTRRGVVKAATNVKDTKLMEEKFKLENFDLIVWEYVSK